MEETTTTNTNATTKDPTTSTNKDDGQSLKLALAISLLRSKLLQSQNQRRQPQPQLPPDSKAFHWKRKAKERKQELLRLRQDLKDASRCDFFTEGASCKCFFFDDLGKIIISDHRFNDVLRRRFLRQVRLKQWRRTEDGSNGRLRFSDLNGENEIEQLRAPIDFLVDLCDSASPSVVEPNFANWCHQAVDFILASLRNQLLTGKNMEFIEGIVNSLIMRLVRRVCSPSQGAGSCIDTDAQFYIQHLVRKLGSEAYIGQRALLSISQRISVLAENLLFMDPFDDAFPNIHRCLYILIQLIEFLVSDHLFTWSNDESFDNVVFEEGMISLLHAQKALGLLESRNGLYVLYMDRVMAQLAKQVLQVPSLQKLNQDILHNLYC